MRLAAKGLAHDDVECDPFQAAARDRLRALHPFGRVPVLEAGNFASGRRKRNWITLRPSHRSRVCIPRMRGRGRGCGK